MIVFELLLLSYFIYSVFYTFTFSLAGIQKNNGKPNNNGQSKPHKIAVMIPAYKEDAVIVPVAVEALKQNYPSNYFDVVVIADSLQENTLGKLKQLPVTLIRVKFEQSTKVKALNKAMSELPDDYDIGLILDADNIMEEGFLRKINDSYNLGNNVIQGRRVAKNMNTSFAILDALSETINNHIYRKGTCALGFSCSLIGSGMAFDYRLLKSSMKDMTSIGGFDRELELILLGQGFKATYLKEALVYDEKVEKPEVFASQRRRWISSQYIYLKKYFGKGIKSLLKGNLVYFNSSILRNIQLPRLLNLGFLTVITLFASFASDYVGIYPGYWWLLLGIYISSFLLAIPLNFYNKEFFRAIANLPKAFFLMFLSLLKLKNANKAFIHTPHTNMQPQGWPRKKM